MVEFLCNSSLRGGYAGQNSFLNSQYLAIMHPLFFNFDESLWCDQLLDLSLQEATTLALNVFEV